SKHRATPCPSTRATASKPWTSPSTSRASITWRCSSSSTSRRLTLPARHRRVGRAILAQQDLFAAFRVLAVVEGIRRRPTVLTEAKLLRILGELHVHALVEDVQRALPLALIPLLLAVADDVAVDLVDLLKAAVLHQLAEHLTPIPAGAVADDRLVLHPVVLAAIQ